MGKQFVKIGETIVKKQSIVYVKRADMQSPRGENQLMLRISGVQAHLYVPTEQTVQQVYDLMNAE